MPGDPGELVREMAAQRPAFSCWRLGALSAVEHRPADVVPQPLVVEYERANRLRELVALPPALESPRALARSFWCGGACGLDRIGGRAKLVRGDVCDDCGLTGSIRGMPRCAAQVSGRAHCMTARRASLGHRDLATRPGAGLLNRPTWSWVVRLSRLEEIKDMLRARRRPQSEELVIRIGEGSTTANRHETRVAVFRQDHTQRPFCLLSGESVADPNLSSNSTSPTGRRGWKCGQAIHQTPDTCPVKGKHPALVALIQMSAELASKLGSRWSSRRRASTRPRSHAGCFPPIGLPLCATL